MSTDYPYEYISINNIEIFNKLLKGEEVPLSELIGVKNYAWDHILLTSKGWKDQKTGKMIDLTSKLKPIQIKYYIPNAKLIKEMIGDEDGYS